MNPNKTTLFVPVLLIAVGCGWLLTIAGVAPDVDWVWTLLLAAVGLMTFIIGGLDKVTLVVGPFLLLASILSWLRQSGELSAQVEMPLLLISVGVLTLIARLPFIPHPKWLDSKTTERGQ